MEAYGAAVATMERIMGLDGRDCFGKIFIDNQLILEQEGAYIYELCVMLKQNTLII
jgi:hypothetical protein